MKVPQVFPSEPRLVEEETGVVSHSHSYSNNLRSADEGMSKILREHW